MNKTVLLVGGPEHGKIYAVQKHTFNIKVPVPKPVTFSYPEEIDPFELATYDVHIYNNETLNFFGHYMTVYFHENLMDNGTTERHQDRGRLLGELLINDLGKTLLQEGSS